MSGPAGAPTRVALLGAGVVGNGWATHLLTRGHIVSVHDPGPDAEQRLHHDIEAARPAVEALGLDLDGWESRLRFAATVAEAVEGASFVQESGPEREDVKSSLLRETDRATPAEVVIASSSSGMMPSELAAMCPAHPERVVIGHPFSPVYLIPLVEVVGAPDTPAETIATALAFYERIGKHPIHVRHEVPGHLANRLQAALWREAYSLVERGIATVADVDAAVSHGPGLRWALLGPLANQHLAGGAGGLAHVLEHLGPPAQRWMDDLGSSRMTPELAATLVAGVHEELDGIDASALAAERDQLLIGLLAAKQRATRLP